MPRLTLVVEYDDAAPIEVGYGTEVVVRTPKRSAEGALRIIEGTGKLVSVEFGDALHDADDDESTGVGVRRVAADGNVTEMDFDAPERVVALFVHSFSKLFEQHPTAENYVQLEVRRAGEDAGYIVTVQRSDRKSPHELRVAAEAQRDEAEILLREMVAQHCADDGTIHGSPYTLQAFCLSTNADALQYLVGRGQAVEVYDGLGRQYYARWPEPVADDAKE
jgi:hypothetical protein